MHYYDSCHDGVAFASGAGVLLYTVLDPLLRTDFARA